MADERASLTLTLTDEMSDGLRTISEHFEELKRSMGDTGKIGQDTFKSLQNQLKQLQDQAEKGSGRGLVEGITGAKAPMEDMTKALETVLKTLGKVGPEVNIVTRVLGDMSSTLLRMGTSIPGLVGGVGALTIAYFKLGTSAAEANRQAKLLMLQLGETSEQGIESFKALGESAGIGAQKAIQSL